MVEIQGQNLNASVKTTEVKKHNELEADSSSSNLPANQAQAKTNDLDTEIKEIHEQTKNELIENLDSEKYKSSNKIQEFFKNGPAWFQNFRNYFVMALNTGQSGEPVQAQLTFSNVGNTGNKGTAWGNSTNGASNEHTWVGANFASGSGDNKIVTGFKVKTSSSNISGNVAIYGLQKAV